MVSLSAAQASAVTVTLNAAVSWQLDLAAGTTTTVADLASGRVAGIVVTKGSDVIDLTLPRPDASVTASGSRPCGARSSSSACPVGSPPG